MMEQSHLVSPLECYQQKYFLLWVLHRIFYETGCFVPNQDRELELKLFQLV